GLLFTYGVTSSGKTYTMTGSLEEPGFLPRCLDMLFNSITAVQASKYVFVPDGMNGFHVQSEADALLEKQERDILPQLTPKTPNNPWVQNKMTSCHNINPECRYSVFVSYVEIYNDYVYDLLGDVQLDPFNRPKPPQSKRLREDKNKNMFVYGVSQVEVASTEEAFAAFQQGQERRRIAHTQLNAESSRSHSILNIRLVQAPLDPLGEDLLQERSLICASQLSLVDLAGSERMARTGAGGERSREAGNINSSLMTLRRCLEQLRENQKNGSSDMVKYRNSKLTHLFKSYFEGHGKVKMVVCLNPNMAEYDENIVILNTDFNMSVDDENSHVVQFAEMAQQVEVARSEDFKVDTESIKRKAMEAKVKAEEERRKQHTAMKQLNKEASVKKINCCCDCYKGSTSPTAIYQSSIFWKQEKNAMLKSSQSDSRRLEMKMKGAVANTKAHVEKECVSLLLVVKPTLNWSNPILQYNPLSLSDEKRVRTVQTEMQEKMWVKDERLRQLKNIISTGAVTRAPGPPVATKHRRSCSASHSNWLAHLPSSTVQTETILQPAIRPNKVVNVPSPKDVAGASKYLLTHQREDGTGEIETQLVKGEVFHTRSGGQQVQFVDIETLKQ
uniref:Kinesin-like protein n=1 Tax=Ciona savignyi TaxID=51511 RepID=H2YQY9_CIOSA